MDGKGKDEGTKRRIRKPRVAGPLCLVPLVTFQKVAHVLLQLERTLRSSFQGIPEPDEDSAPRNL